jgi:hypothetical protein
VLSSTNGCSELSEVFAGFPEWSGYYFDAMGNPCTGDTVAFAVLHINGSLNGSESILWFKNDTLLPGMINEDTLLISASGKYECKVIDPNSNCPLDTTSYAITYDCSLIGIDENETELSWMLFPNPASEIITVKFMKYPLEEYIQIYSAVGRLVKVVRAAPTTSVDIDDLPAGLYFLRLKNNAKSPLKFIRQ